MATASASTCVSSTNLRAFLRVGQQLVMAQRALDAMPVFLLAAPMLEAAKDAKFALDRDAAEMRHIGHLFRHADIVVPIRRCLAIGLQRAIFITEVKPAWIAVMQVAASLP